MSLLVQLLRHGQHFLVYPAAFLPWPRDVERPYGSIPWEDLELVTSDGITLHCYLFRPDSAASAPGSSRNSESESSIISESVPQAEKLATVIVFHGNAMNYGHCISAAWRFYLCGCNVLILSYRGYGNSKGYPNEKGLQKDAQAALDFVLAEPQLSQKPIILAGSSLGGAVAIDLASRNPDKIHALMLENTFTSIPDLVRGWPLIGHLAFLCHQKWDSAFKIPLLPPSIPILMMSGERDMVVPRAHMLKLRDLASARGQNQRRENEEAPVPPKVVTWFFRHGTHVDTSAQHGYWEKVALFLSDVLPRPAPISEP